MAFALLGGYKRWLVIFPGSQSGSKIVIIA